MFDIPKYRSTFYLITHHELLELSMMLSFQTLIQCYAVVIRSSLLYTERLALNTLPNGIQNINKSTDFRKILMKLIYYFNIRIVNYLLSSF